MKLFHDIHHNTGGSKIAIFGVIFIEQYRPGIFQQSAIANSTQQPDSAMTLPPFQKIKTLGFP